MRYWAINSTAARTEADWALSPSYMAMTIAETRKLLKENSWMRYPGWSWRRKTRSALSFQRWDSLRHGERCSGSENRFRLLCPCMSGKLTASRSAPVPGTELTSLKSPANFISSASLAWSYILQKLISECKSYSELVASGPDGSITRSDDGSSLDGSALGEHELDVIVPARHSWWFWKKVFLLVPWKMI